MNWLSWLQRLWISPLLTRDAAAEQQACRWLQARGLRLLQQNYRCRQGEIDLVMQDGAQLVFVEVRMRSSDHAGGAAASVSSAKQRRLRAAAAHYLLRWRNPPRCRFDVLAIDGEQMQWLQNVIDTRP